VVRDPDGKVNIKQSISMTGRGASYLRLAWLSSRALALPTLADGVVAVLP
jgi:hypothetical protein